MSDAAAGFELHPRLEADTSLIARFALSRLLLMEDARYPWFILVPQRSDVREIHELALPDQQQLMRESCLLGNALMRAFRGDKLNVAALGNVVPQLHVHHIVRFTTDDAWPVPVWGRHPTQMYSADLRRQRIQALKSNLAEATWSA